MRGVNLAGAEFGEHEINGQSAGQHGSSYIYPIPEFVEGYDTPAELSEAGFNTFRLPFRWERLQPQLGEPLDQAELRRLRKSVDYLNSRGAYVILNPHNYARYRGRVVGDGVKLEAFADFWGRLAAQFERHDGVVFGLMNEPHNMPTEQWVDAANVAIRAIRSAGASNLILVPGNHWSGAHAWYSFSYGISNATALLTIQDPLDFLAFEAHQYINHDASGSTPDCVGPQAAVSRLEPFTTWLRANGKKGLLGEFGGGPSAACRSSVDAMLRHMERNGDVYIGWTAWSAGPWWPQDYFLSLEPNSAGRPQLDVLMRYLPNTS